MKQTSMPRLLGETMLRGLISGILWGAMILIFSLLMASIARAQDPHETMAQQLEQIAAQLRGMIPPQGPPTIDVPAGGDLQGVLNTAPAGSHVVLQAGARYTGAFRLPARTSGAPITVRVAGTLPERRLIPADLPFLATIATDSLEPALYCTGSLGWRFEGISFEGPVAGGREIIAVKDCEDLVFDRILAIGGVNGQRRGIRVNGVNITVRRSHIANIWEQGADSQAICGWDNARVISILDNYLEAASENILFGGSDSTTSERIPADILIEGNHLFKPLAWKGTYKNVKNLFELKAALRVVVRNNLMENNWVDGQDGHGVLFTVRNQYGAATWSRIEDVLFEGNIVTGTPSGVNVLGSDDERPSGIATRITIRRNLWILNNGSFFQAGGEAGEITLDHNTILGVRWRLLGLYKGDIWKSGVKGPALYSVERFTFTNNLAIQGEYGMFGEGGYLGTAALTNLTMYPTVTHNAIARGIYEWQPYPGVIYRPTLEEFNAAFDASWNLLSGHPWTTSDQTGGALGR